jgi:hypothetical protein
MLSRLIRVLMVSVMVAMPMALMACEVSHHETTKTNAFGKTTHTESTTVEHP